MSIKSLAQRWCCTFYTSLQKRLFNPPPVVSVLSLHGVIGHTGKLRGGGMTLDSLQENITKAFKATRVKAVVLRVNSPGGSPVQSALIARLIREQAIENDVPVIAFIEDVGASGGYWLACAADKIYALEASIVGSIGVVAAGFGFTEFIQKHGIERRIYTQGKNKAMLDPFMPEKPDDVKQLKAAQKDVHESFVAWVKERRGEKLSAKDAELFTGGIWSGVGAYGVGLIDDLGDYRSYCRAQFGADVVFKVFDEKKGFFARKFGILSPSVWIEELCEAVVQRTLWARFGL